MEQEWPWALHAWSCQGAPWLSLQPVSCRALQEAPASGFLLGDSALVLGKVKAGWGSDTELTDMWALSCLLT